jgi:targeting protein for Xklp2
MICRVKSAAEIEEELLAKLPKFKARPLPKKVGIYLLLFA